jgi:hypothetical protein
MIRRCAQEHETWAASASGRWTPALSEHAARCAPCADVRLVTEALTTTGAPMPASTDPSVLWWCARYMRRLRIVSRIERVTAVGQLTTVGAALAVAGSFVDWPAVLALVAWPTAAYGKVWMVALPVIMAMTAVLLVFRWRELPK